MMIDWLVIGAALMSGLLGGVHCAAMCGGIATGLSSGQRPASAGAQWLQALQPNLGRVLGYTLAGAIVGGFGHGLVAFVQIPNLALAMRMAVGAMMMVIALRLLYPKGAFNPLARPGRALWQRLQPLQRGLLPAEKALNRRLPILLSTASAMMLHAELWVHKNNTLMILSVALSLIAGSPVGG